MIGVLLFLFISAYNYALKSVCLLAQHSHNIFSIAVNISNILAPQFPKPFWGKIIAFRQPGQNPEQTESYLFLLIVFICCFLASNFSTFALPFSKFFPTYSDGN